jgi:two-component system, sensor histidine kinase and response regulator
LEAKAASSDSARILVVDDNEDNRALLRSCLEDESYRVVTATNGEEGIRSFQDSAPDCVLLDVRMPGMDGFATCAKMRSLPGGADTPIVFLTALRDIETFDRALGAGGDDFLTKPIRPTELIVRVQAALKLRRMSAEIREYYDLIRRQRDDLMRVQLQKDRLTAFIVHDLKNPVNAMDLHAQVLLRNPDLPKTAQPSVQHIRDGARSLMRLVVNLLDLSKSEEGKLAPRYAEVDVDRVTAEAMNELDLTAQMAGVSLSRTIEASSVRADPDLLRRVIENLLENAIRHSPEGSQVRLTSALRDSELEIRVSDAGTGVPPEMRDKIFEPFVQVEKGERVVTRAGRGLGLTFCKLAVEAHGGTICVEDGAPGAVFCVRFPR